MTRIVNFISGCMTGPIGLQKEPSQLYLENIKWLIQFVHQADTTGIKPMLLDIVVTQEDYIYEVDGWFKQVSLDEIKCKSAKCIPNYTSLMVMQECMQ